MGATVDAGVAGMAALVINPPPERWLLSMVCSFVGISRSCAGQESVDVGGELGVVLEEEAVRRVRVDLEMRPWDEAGEQIGVARRNHWVAVTVGDEHRLVDRRDPLEQRVVRLSP